MERFFVDELSHNPEKDCGTNKDFVAAMASTVYDFAELQQAVERIETAGMMAREIEDDVAKMKEQIEAKCGTRRPQ